MGYFVHTDGDIRLLIPFLIEAGFDYVTDIDDVKLFKKRK